MSSGVVDEVEVVGNKGDSDHFPIVGHVSIDGLLAKRKGYVLESANRVPTETQSKELFQGGWPLQPVIPEHLPLSKRLVVRPRIFLSKGKKEILGMDASWQERLELLKRIDRKEYSSFLRNITSFASFDLKEYHRSVNRVLKFRKSGRVVSNIRVGSSV